VSELSQHDFGMQHGHAPIAHRVAAVDFDGTIIPWAALNHPHTEGLRGAVDAIKALREQGYKIVIFTSRLSPRWHAASGETLEDQTIYVKSVLKRLGIEYDEITAEKIPCQLYLDDKAISVLDDWDKVMASINSGVAKDELAWATGLFEGEGSIVFRPVNRVILQLSMSDKDAVDRLQGLFGTGSRWTENRPGKKPIYGWRIQNGAGAKRVLESMLPWLGERRRGKAIEALERISHNRRTAIA